MTLPRSRRKRPTRDGLVVEPRAARGGLVVFAAGSSACDGHGCAGGRDGAATKFCQDAIERASQGSGTIDAADACKQCCLQDVPYVGRIEDGKCVCRLR